MAGLRPEGTVHAKRVEGDSAQAPEIEKMTTTPPPFPFPFPFRNLRGSENFPLIQESKQQVRPEILCMCLISHTGLDLIINRSLGRKTFRPSGKPNHATSGGDPHPRPGIIPQLLEEQSN